MVTEVAIKIILTIFFCSVLFFFFMFITMENPISMSLVIILTSISLSMIVWVMMSKWMAMSLILVFVGGMMVTILYVSSLSVNQKIYVPDKLSLVFIMFFISWKLYLFNLSLSEMFFPSILYSSQNFILMEVMISYLLIVLLFVVKICETFKGSLIEKF